jgi:AAA domain, putative AbiEii toxin, Type IV TA system/AAA domain
MRLRYLSLQNYGPIKNVRVCFASGSPLDRQCAIRFVVGLNGSGKSNLLRAVAEVFLALADERLPPFPVTLIYELGTPGNSATHFTFIVDCPSGSKAEAAVWVANGWRWPDTADEESFAAAILALRQSEQVAPFRSHIARGTWPQQPGIAMPKAVLAYTTGDSRPWQSVWDSNQDADGLMTGREESQDDREERPAGWSAAHERALHPLQETASRDAPPEVAQSASEPSLYRRPILLDPTSLKCALLAVALPQAFIETPDNTERLPQSLSATFRGLRGDRKNTLQDSLERGGWRYLVSVAFECRMQSQEWDRKVSETAHDWLLCATEVVAQPHPREVRRTLFFDLRSPCDVSAVGTRQSYEWLPGATTAGEALWALLGGPTATSFERFMRLLELHRAGLFEGLLLRARVRPVDGADDPLVAEDADEGVMRYEELSDGEQMVLGRMALFHLLENQDDALLLLDEPETHFNDKWKREIVSIVDQAIGQTANDVLISTHSALVLSDVFDKEITFIEKTEKGSIVRPLAQRTFGGDPGELMIRVFGAEDSTGKRAQRFIEEELQQLQGSAADIERVRALANQMGQGFYRSELETLLNKWTARK